MLFLLTGNTQIGKTRWLCRLIEQLGSLGIPCYGVVAPGAWAKSDSQKADGNGFEKLGIDNMLLPCGDTLRFADRADIVKDSGAFQPCNPSAKAELGWYIHEDAADRVNAHCAAVPAMAAADGRPGLLVIDELGRLELLHGEGLTEAMALLAAGPSPYIRHSLLVVRDTLADRAESLYGDLWGGAIRLGPDEASWDMLFGLVTCK